MEAHQLIHDPNGIDPQYCDGGMWGRAAYFERNAYYSDDYAYELPNRTKQMFYCLVYVGKFHSCKKDESLRNPPPGFTSIKGHTNGSPVYMVYKNDRAYMDALITYLP